MIHINWETSVKNRSRNTEREDHFGMKGTRLT